MASPLRFRPDGRFRIVQFTDLHWHNGGTKDLQTRAMMETVLEAERPDLVALTGDVIAGGGCENPAESWRQAVAPMEERGIPWAAVFGNHDDEGSLGRRELMEMQQTCRMSLLEPGPEEVSGVGNYVLRVLSQEGDSLAAALYFLDSNAYATHECGGYGWITRSQVAWYLDTARALEEEYRAVNSLESEFSNSPTPLFPEAKLPALAFFHIPLPEYDEVWETQVCRGHKYEDVCCPRINTGFFAALLEAGEVMGTFVGHDHVNDYEGTLHGIRLCYGRWGGYSTYGLDRLQPGARVIELREGEREFETWLRLADGTAVTDPPEHAPQERAQSE